MPSLLLSWRILLSALTLASAVYATSALAAAPAAPVAARQYAVAMLPLLPPAEIRRRWQPLLDRINRDSGLRLHFVYYKDNAAFDQAIAQGKAEFAVLTPLQAWRQRGLYRPLLRSGVAMTGLIVVRADSPLQQLSDLQNRTLALHAGDNQTISLFLQKNLAQQTLQVRWQPSHSASNALRSVLLGRADAAISDNFALRCLPPAMAQQLRSIHTIISLPAPPLAARIDLPAADVTRLYNAIMDLQKTQPKLLHEALLDEVTGADLERDYAPVAQLFGGRQP